MKKALFISVTYLDFGELQGIRHLQNKFDALSKEIKPYVLAKGRPFHKKIWNTDFYLLPPGAFFWPQAFLVAFYLCLIKKIDVIVAQSPLIEGLVGSFLSFLFQEELIVEVHGDWIEGPFLSKKRKWEALEKRIVPFLAWVSFKSADKIRGVTGYLIKRAKKIAPNKKYFLFPAFTELNLFLKEKDIRFDNFILFVGGLKEVKGINYLIKAFSRIASEFPKFRLILVGEGSERKNLESLISDLERRTLSLEPRTPNPELKHRIEFKGRLSLKETKEVMKRCYCLVLPSLSEGLPRALMEAAALEKPLIGSKVGGIPDIIKDGYNGFLFEKGNIKDLADKLRSLLKDPDLAQKMGRRNREFARQRFSNRKHIENYIKMINS